MTTITIEGFPPLKFDGETWTCEVQGFADTANDFTQGAPMIHDDYYPDTDILLARELAEIMGGKVTQHDPPEAIEGRIY